MQTQILDKIKDSRLKAFVAWCPAYGTDDDKLAKQGAKILNDSRAKHYWDGKTEAALAFSKVVTLPRDAPIAYDVFMIFGPDAQWGAEVPKPLDYAHQIVEDERFLNPVKFREKIVRELERLTKKLIGGRGSVLAHSCDALGGHGDSTITTHPTKARRLSL